MKPSKRMWWALAVAVLGVATTASATTVKVDGVGDGDGDTVDDFDNISLALNSLGALGIDGTPDVINVVVDKIPAHPGILINGTNAIAPGGAPPIAFNILTDDITINGDADGNGSPCVVVLAAGTKGTALAGGYSFTTARFVLEVANGQDVVVRDLTLIPEFVVGVNETRNVASDGGLSPNCMYIDEAGTPANTVGVTTLLERVTVTGADANNDPVNPFAPPIGVATYWGSDSSFVSQITYASNNAGANQFVHTLTDVVAAHGASASATSGVHGVGIFADGNQSPANSQAQFVFNGGTFTRNGNAKGAFGGLVCQGIQASGANGTEIILNDVTSTFNGKDSAPIGTTGNGLSATATLATFAQRIVVNGGNYSNNFGGGIFLNTSEVTAGAPSTVVELNGTDSDPIFLQNNAAQGLRLGSTTNSDILIDRAEGMIITGNASHGIEFFEIQNAAYDPPGPDPNITFRNCLLANNRTNFRNGDGNAAPATLSFVDCTFHNPGNLTPAAPAFADAHIVLNFGGSDLFRHNFIDCIFSGGDATDRLVAIGDQDATFTDDGDNNAFNFLNCSIVQAGPHTNNTTINALFFNGSDPAGSNNNTINGTNINAVAAIPAGNITVNPNYASTTPGGFTSDFLDVQNAFPAPAGYADFPIALNNLAGGADFLNVLPDNTVTPTPALPWTLTFFDNNGDDPTYTPNGNASVSVTAFSGTLPLVWTATNPQTDPSTVFPITAAHLDEEHWNISHNQAPGALTADLTLHWDLADHNLNPGVTNIHRFNGAIWQVVNTPFAGSSPIPGLFYIQAVGLTQFSPFALIDNLTLAVDLASLSAAQTGNTVTVSWSTAAELDNAGFVVYRANADGSRGEKLSGLIPAEGTATAGASYSFVDDAPFAAGETSRSYLLVDIDLAGSETNHGPATATLTTGAPSSVGNWTLY